MTRRGRHIPRLCETCSAPLAGQEDTCWRCGAAWVDRDGRDDEPGGLSGAALSDLEDRGAIMAAEPSADDAALVTRA
jgi:hypothetical protein